VGCDAVLLGDGHVDQLIETIGPYQIQPFFKFGIQASAKAIPFANITVCMIPCILAQVVENLCVLHHDAGSLS
jgi:hypothetical protein